MTIRFIVGAYFNEPIKVVEQMKKEKWSREDSFFRFVYKLFSFVPAFQVKLQALEAKYQGIDTKKAVARVRKRIDDLWGKL